MNRLVLIGLLLVFSGCRPSHTPEAGPEQLDPAAKQDEAQATASPAEAEVDPEEEAKWRRINGVEIFHRSFQVRAGEQPIGDAVLTLREFQGGVLLRTGLEYWLFRREVTTEPRKAEYWFQGYCSEMGDQRPMAVWGTGFWHDLPGKFRLQGEQGNLKVTGNRWGGYKNPRIYKPPEGYRLLLALRDQMKKAIHEEGPNSFSWQRCLWREDPLKWHTYDYHYAGAEKVVSAEGKEYSGYRFDVTPVGDGLPAETVWVDDEGLPLRRVVPEMNKFEMLVSETQREIGMTGTITWADAAKLFGTDEASLTVLPADIAF